MNASFYSLEMILLRTDPSLLYDSLLGYIANENNQ